MTTLDQEIKAVDGTIQRANAEITQARKSLRVEEGKRLGEEERHRNQAANDDASKQRLTEDKTRIDQQLAKADDLNKSLQENQRKFDADLLKWNQLNQQLQAYNQQLTAQAQAGTPITHQQQQEFHRQQEELNRLVANNNALVVTMNQQKAEYDRYDIADLKQKSQTKRNDLINLDHRIAQETNRNTMEEKKISSSINNINEDVKDSKQTLATATAQKSSLLTEKRTAEQAEAKAAREEAKEEAKQAQAAQAPPAWSKQDSIRELKDMIAKEEQAASDANKEKKAYLTGGMALGASVAIPFVGQIAAIATIPLAIISFGIGIAKRYEQEDHRKSADKLKQKLADTIASPGPT